MNLKPLAILVLIVANLTVFARITRFGFIWRDEERIVEVMRDETTTMKTIWTKGVADTFAPLTYSVWYGLYRLGVSTSQPTDPTANATIVTAENARQSIDPRWFHILNIVGHLIAALTVLFILDLMLNNLLAAWLGAMLFSLHPLQVESLSLAYGLKTIMGGALSLLAVWNYLLFSSKINSYRSEERSKAWRSVTYGTGFYVAACLANPLSIVTPIFALVLERLLPGQRSLLSDRKPKGPIVFWALLAIPAAVTAMGSEVSNHLMPSLWEKPFLASGTIWLYLAKAFVPIKLAPDYGWTPIHLLARWETYASMLLTATVVVSLLWWREKPRTWYAASISLFCVAILPTSGLARFGFQGLSTISDRFAYLAVFALAIGFAYAMTARRAQMVQVGGIVFTLTLAYLAREQTKFWESPEALWKQTATVNPASLVARMELGKEALHKGDSAQAFDHFTVVVNAGASDPTLFLQLANVEAKLGKPDAAIQHFKRAIELNSGLQKAHAGLAQALFEKGLLAEALPVFERAIELNDKDPEALLHFGIALQKLGKFDNALKQLERVLVLTPNNVLAHALLGSVQAKLGHPEEAIRHLRAALAAKVEDPATRLILAGVLFSQGQFDEAAPHYDAALIAFPNNFEAHNNYGVILLGQKKYDQGIQQIQAALKIAPGDAEVYQNMGVAMFHLRRLQESQQNFAKALSLNAKLPMAYFYQGEIARFQGDKIKARSLYFTAIRYERDHPESHHQLGNMDYQEEKYEKAVYHFEAALRARPNSEKTQANLQRAKHQLDRKGAH